MNLASDGRDIHLVLFFTHGVSLKTWFTVGMLEREVAIYRRLMEKGARITFVTYGGSEEPVYARDVEGVRILHNVWGLPTSLYSFLIPLLHRSDLAMANVYRTNQTNGSMTALRASRLWKKPVIARSGYMWSELASYGGPARKDEAEKARRLESKIFGAADRIVVTTPTMHKYVKVNYPIEDKRVRIIPNYVLTDLFTPAKSVAPPNRLCFIGRLGPEKNPLALVEACAGLNVHLVIVGEGPLRAQIEHLAASLEISVELLGNQPHRRLPDILRASSIFLLVSPHEGHPKALLEAMSCGLAVIGANSPGIRELIQHDQNGWLCEGDPSSIRDTIRTLMRDPDRRSRLGRNARKFVVDNFALDKIVELEMALIREVLGSY